MKKTALILTTLVVIAIVIASHLWRSNPSSTNGKPVVKIGAMFALTGNMQDVGNSGFKAFTKSIEDANRNPDNKLYYELLVEDDQMNAHRAHTITNKFVSVDDVNVLIGYFSVPARVIAPLAAKHKIINFNTSFATDIFKSKYNFQNCMTIRGTSEGQVRFLKFKGHDSVTLLFANFAAADDILEELLPLLSQNNIKVEIERFVPGERDFKMIINKLKASPTGAVILYAFPPELDIIAKELKQQQVDKTISVIDLIPMVANLALFEGVYNVGTNQISEALRKHVGLENQTTLYATYLYDTGKIIVEAFEKTYDGKEIPSADTVADFIHGYGRWKGEVGEYTVDSRGQFATDSKKTIEITVVKDGKLIKVEE